MYKKLRLKSEQDDRLIEQVVVGEMDGKTREEDRKENGRTT